MLRFCLDLPQPYRFVEVAAFHGRDPQRVAEESSDRHIRKGVVLDGVPVVFQIALGDGKADCQAWFDGDSDEETLRRTCANLLALPVDLCGFEATFASDEFLGPLVRERPGLRIAQTASPFEALTWAIIGQQINLPFAISLRRTLIYKAGRRHSSGSWCYPGPAEVAALEPETLTAEKFSRAKAEAVIRVARANLDLDGWRALPPEEIAARLVAIKGVGPWTAQYTLLRGFGWVDCSLHGDAAVRNALTRVFAIPKPDGPQAEAILARYRPYRSLASAHFWASLSKEA